MNIRSCKYKLAKISIDLMNLIDAELCKCQLTKQLNDEIVRMLHIESNLGLTY